MTREEILKKSREENMGVDVADYEAAKAGIKYGWMVLSYRVFLLWLMGYCYHVCQ